MKNIIRKTWRDSASLIVLAKQCRETLSRRDNRAAVNYDILLQTRNKGASSFANSVVFPGGVTETADASAEWIQLIKLHGYSQKDFDALHTQGSPLSPIFQSDPVNRHISLRITAIRETFEELGVLVCSREQKHSRSSLWADYITDFDFKHWQNKVSENPEEFLNLCKELNCYPDIWSLHYWSNWLTPCSGKKRFDTAFFITSFKDKLVDITCSNEVAHVEWSDPLDILEKEKKGEVLLFPPQIYEFNRLSYITDIKELIKFAKHRSSLGNELLYPIKVYTKDAWMHVLSGDDLDLKTKDYNNDTLDCRDKTTQELRENSSVLHRFETTKSSTTFIIRNLKPLNHINMGDITIKLHRQ